VRTPFFVFACLASFATPVLAQPSGGLVGAISGRDWDGRTVRAARPLVADGDLSAADVDALLAAAGARVNAAEGGTILGLLDKKVGDLPEYAVTDEARDRLVNAARLLDLQSASREAVEAGKTYAGTEPPRSVQEVLARARLNGAVAYDVTETNADGEGVYSDYPSLTPATENMRFSWTEVTPAALEADKNDTRPHLRLAGVERVTIDGDEVSLVRYRVSEGGSGSISAAYDEAYHPVRGWGEGLRVRLGYPEWMRAWSADAVREARSTSGDRWASNCAILADGSIHCLPAARRHSATPGLILTNPALARGRQVLWNGHLTARAGVITSVGTSGRISKRAAEGRDVFVNPLPLLKAWGFEVAPGLQVRSEHSTARYLQDDEGCVLRQVPPG
jgi:hypothetical protein